MSRLPRRDDDRGSLAMAMMAVLVGAILGALIMPIVISQNKSTRFDITRVHSLHAAQTGVDVMVGRIRASTKPVDSSVTGDAVRLPCQVISGTANDGTVKGTYSVSVVYWASTPPGTGASASPGAPARTPMLCSRSYGTYDPSTRAATPRYAVVTSTGNDGTVDSGSRGRTLVSTYVFQTDESSSVGGQFRLFSTSATDRWCMEPAIAAPVQGTRVVLRACVGSTSAVGQQAFVYRGDLSIQLVSSVTTATPNGLCLDTDPTAHADSVGVVLKTCVAASPAKCADITRCSPWNQQWSVDDNGHFSGARSDQSDIDGWCLHAPAQLNGTAIIVKSCGDGNQDVYQRWVPSPNVGAGMAGAGNKQLVNNRLFATCLDVTAQLASSSYLILYLCKQNPSPSKVRWNQKFTPTPALVPAPTDTLLKTTDDGGNAYCLLSPSTVGGYVRLAAPCPATATTPSPSRWTVFQTQDVNGNDLPSAQKFTVVDSNGLCLAPGPNSDLYDNQYLKAVVATCDGSVGQKWNATPGSDKGILGAVHETLTP